MTTLIATFEFKGYPNIATLIAVFAAFGIMRIYAGVVFARRLDEKLKPLARQVRELQRKLDALLEHQGIEMPTPASGMSPEVEQLAKDPKTKIAAIALYREENPGTGLREAKELIEGFYKSQK